MTSAFGLPLALLTDSYKPTHYSLYPEAKEMSAYGEFRTSFNQDPLDGRIVFYGIRHIVEHYISKPWTTTDLVMAEQFFNTHNAGYTPFPFPRELFEKFIRENEGYFPVTIQALPEGTVCYPHTPVYQITAKEPYSPLVTYLETLLTMVWYPSSVATLSRRVKSILQSAFEKSVDKEKHFLLQSRLHDFGFRACTSVEQSIIGGCAHLVNFDGSDTLSASFYAQYHLNEGRPIASSIPATEHSVMTSHPDEKEALETAIREYGDGLFACVMDSYDYVNALEKILPSIAKQKLEKGGFMVLRPDSGDPVETVLQALRAADKVFGSDKNKKGFKVLRGCGVIQGDGINYDSTKAIIDAVLKEGFSAENVAFGMGGGLLQRLHRDVMSFATKVSKIVYKNGHVRNVMKYPRHDSTKISLPGTFFVSQTSKGPNVYPLEHAPKGQENMLKVVYDCGPVRGVWDTFDAIRARVEKEWNLIGPSYVDPVSSELKQLIEDCYIKMKPSSLP